MTIDNDFTFLIVMVVTFIGLFAAILYYFMRFFFQAGRYDEENKKSSEPPSSSPTQEEKTSKTEILPRKELDLRTALAHTKAHLYGRMKALFQSEHDISAKDRENLEEILYTSDFGPKTVQRLLDALDEQLVKLNMKANLDNIRSTLRSEILAIFSQVQKNSSSVSDVLHIDQIIVSPPRIWLIVGVNGVGKTTTIGKLANAVAKSGKKVLVAAGDTFRAAAGAQLQAWSERAQVEIFSPPGVTDPSAVAFDACHMAKARGFDVVIIDTAGRLHTQNNLMEELNKMKRVVQKVVPEGPHEVLLVLDANSGQNALMQARNFHNILTLTGVVLTKMDGTAKGGVAVGLAGELNLPIRLIGVGEGIDDLRPFRSEEFVESII